MTTDTTHVERLKLVEIKVKALEEGQAEVKIALVGDMKGAPGALQNLVRVMNTIWSDKDALVPRLTNLERIELERKGFIKGAHWVSALIGGGVVFLLERIAHVIWK